MLLPFQSEMVRILHPIMKDGTKRRAGRVVGGVVVVVVVGGGAGGSVR